MTVPRPQVPWVIIRGTLSAFPRRLHVSELWHGDIFGFGDRGRTMVKVLCYKSGSGWFDPSWCHWNFSLT